MLDILVAQLRKSQSLYYHLKSICFDGDERNFIACYDCGKKNECDRVKNDARYKARMGLQAGSIKRKSCEICQNKSDCMHHEDYRCPSDVVWLCTWCHAHYHRSGEYLNFYKKRYLMNISKKDVFCVDGDECRFQKIKDFKSFLRKNNLTKMWKDKKNREKYLFYGR